MQIFKEKSPPEVTWLVFLETFTTITVTPKDSPPIATSCALLGGWIWECQDPFRPRRTFPLSSTSLSFSRRALPTPNPLFFFDSSTFPVRSCFVPFTPAPSSPEPKRGEHAWNRQWCVNRQKYKRTREGGGGTLVGLCKRHMAGVKVLQDINASAIPTFDWSSSTALASFAASSKKAGEVANL